MPLGASKMEEQYYLLKFYVLMVFLWSLSHLIPFPPLIRQNLKFFWEAMILNVTFVLCIPAVIIFNGVISIARLCLRCCLRVREPEVTLMNSTDAVWSLEGYSESCNFNSLYVLNGTADMKKIQRRFQLLASHPDYSRMRRTLVNRWGFKCWKQTDFIDIRDHVKYISGQNTCANMTETQVFEVMSGFADETFKMNRPPWEVLVVPKFVYSKEAVVEPEVKVAQHYALVIRMHHSVMDGISAGQAIRNVVADYPPVMSLDPCQKVKVSFSTTLATYALAAFVGVRQVVQWTTERDNNRFHSGRRLQGHKNFAWSKKIELAELKRIKDATNNSTTSILLSSMGLALNQVGTKHENNNLGKIHVGATVAILPYPNTKPQNRFMLARIPVNLNCKSRYQTLNECHRSMRELSRYSELLMNSGLLWLTGRWPEIVIQVFMSMVHGTMLLSNVPGFKEPLFMFGDQVVDVVGWPPIKGTTGIGACLFSYNGSVRAALVADSISLPTNSSVKELATAFEDQIRNFVLETKTFTDLKMPYA